MLPPSAMMRFLICDDGVYVYVHVINNIQICDCILVYTYSPIRILYLSGPQVPHHQILEQVRVDHDKLYIYIIHTNNVTVSIVHASVNIDVLILPRQL